MMTTSQAMAASAPADVLVLPRQGKKAPRAYIVGATDTGKSTLMEVLMTNYQEAYSTKELPVRTLIVDTKPRFKAERHLSGITTYSSGKYSKWGYGSGVVPDSYLIEPGGNIKSQLDQVWRLGGKVAIVQSESKSEWSFVAKTAQVFYEGYGAKYPRLLLVDELADFYEIRSLGDIFQRVARNGRERDCSLIAGSQRPRKVPVEIMTEMLRLYMFELNYSVGSESDLRHIMQFGLPPSVLIPQGHVFYMYDRKLKLEPPSNLYYELDLAA